MRPKPQSLQETVIKASLVLPSRSAMIRAELPPQLGQGVSAFNCVPESFLSEIEVMGGNFRKETVLYLSHAFLNPQLNCPIYCPIGS
jgi:hypothetical protein